MLLYAQIIRVYYKVVDAMKYGRETPWTLFYPFRRGHASVTSYLIFPLPQGIHWYFLGIVVCSTVVEQGSSTGISMRLVVRTVKRQPSTRWSAMVLSLVYQQLMDHPLEAPTAQQHRVWYSDWFLPLQSMYWIAVSLLGTWLVDTNIYI